MSKAPSPHSQGRIGNDVSTATPRAPPGVEPDVVLRGPPLGPADGPARDDGLEAEVVQHGPHPVHRPVVGHTSETV